MAGSQFRLAQAGRPSPGRPGPGRQRPGRPGPLRGNNSRFYVFLALLLPAGIVLLPSFIVLSVAMVPTLVAWMIDTSQRKYLAATVGALNFAGSLYFLGRLWAWQHDLGAAVEVLGDVYGWLIAYGAAAAGYGVYYVMPRLTAQVAAFKAQRRLASLERGMQDLVEEWGDPVSRPAPE